MVTLRILAISLLAPLLASSLPADAVAADDACEMPSVVFVQKDRAAGTPRYAAMRRFGNRQRIARFAMPECLDTAGGGILVKDSAGSPRFHAIRRFGNRHRIARRIDPSVVDLSGRVVVTRDVAGRPRAVLLKRFGNKHRIEKLLGESAGGL